MFLFFFVLYLTASIASYFITADKTILECARRNARYEKKDWDPKCYSPNFKLQWCVQVQELVFVIEVLYFHKKPIVTLVRQNFFCALTKMFVTDLLSRLKWLMGSAVYLFLCICVRNKIFQWSILLLELRREETNIFFIQWLLEGWEGRPQIAIFIQCMWLSSYCQLHRVVKTISEHMLEEDGEIMSKPISATTCFMRHRRYSVIITH